MPGAFDAVSALLPSASQTQVQEVLSKELGTLLAALSESLCRLFLHVLCEAEPKLATALLGRLGKAGGSAFDLIDLIRSWQGKLEVALNVLSTLKLARAEINVFHYGALLSASWPFVNLTRDVPGVLTCRELAAGTGLV